MGSKKTFHEAEAYQRNHAVRHPEQLYIAIHDLPKVDNLREQLPELYVVK